MAARASTSNLGLTGIPLFIAIELLIYARGAQTHEEKMDHLAKAYGWLRGYLPTIYEGKKAQEFTKPRIPMAGYDGETLVSISDVLTETSEEISKMYQKYQPLYEGNKSCTDDEKAFLQIMRGVFERLALIISFSGIASKMTYSEDVMF